MLRPMDSMDIGRISMLSLMTISDGGLQLFSYLVNIHAGRYNDLCILTDHMISY